MPPSLCYIILPSPLSLLPLPLSLLRAAFHFSLLQQRPSTSRSPLVFTARPSTVISATSHQVQRHHWPTITATMAERIQRLFPELRAMIYRDSQFRDLVSLALLDPGCISHMVQLMGLLDTAIIDAVTDLRYLASLGTALALTQLCGPVK